MKILKFSSSALDNAENIAKAIQIVKEQYESDSFIVVVAAVKGATDLLIKAASGAEQGSEKYIQDLEKIESLHLDIYNSLCNNGASEELKSINALVGELKLLLESIYCIKELTDRTLDLVMSYGEQLSSLLLQAGFNCGGMQAALVDCKSLIKTNSRFNKAAVDIDLTQKNIKEYFKNPAKLYVAPGFVSSSLKGETTTLGRGGADYTATLFVSALGTKYLEIWTDDDGIMTADPAFVRKAKTIKTLSYDEALELAHFGSKVIFSPSIIPAINEKITIQFKNIHNPDVDGSCICECPEKIKAAPVRGVTSISDVSLVTVQGSGMIGVVGITSRLFTCLSQKHVNVMLITQGSSEHSITFAVTPDESKLAKKLIEKEFKLEIDNGIIEPLKVEEDMSIITVVGEDMKNTPGISARLFDALGRNGISAVATAQGASELNISVVVNKENEKKALNSVHETFFLAGLKTVNVFLVGTGVIGGTLLTQIAQQQKHLLEKSNTEVKVVGIANIDKYLLNEDGIDVANWQSEMELEGFPINLNDFVQKMKDFNLRNSVFVDCTASKDLADLYAGILSSSISVVTPNKQANSSPIDYYEKVHNATARFGVKFLYETNVGAGLPVISTLKDLINSGDEILKVEAMLSGSLNYIFSNLSDTKSFNEVVKEAKEKGFTEPDPRDDLSGKDVGRKLLIIFREMGMKINIEDVDITNCLTKESQDAASVDELWETLEKFDNPVMEEQRKKAADSGKVLKYVGTIENGKAKTAIKEIAPDHPFYNINGSDNIISFTTARYKTNPLIVIGPGAGAEVTAAGVFADVIRIVHS